MIASAAANVASAADAFDFPLGNDENVPPAPKVAAAAKPVKKARGPKKTAQLTMAEMVVDACQFAAEHVVGPGSRKGVSSQAIKKYLFETYGVDTTTHGARLRISKALVAAVDKGTIVQVKGQGASGSFRILKDVKQAKKAAPAKKPKVAKDPAATAKPKKVVATKSKVAKDSSAKPKKAAVKKSAPVKKSATPAKAKAAAKAKAKSSAVEKKTVSPKVPKAPKARKSPMVKKATAAKKK